MAMFSTKRDAEASQARALLVAAKRYTAMKGALDILEHVYNYSKQKDLKDGKYIERAIYTAMSNLKDRL